MTNSLKDHNSSLKKILTIGMATYDDFDGVFFSTQALRLYHLSNITNDIEFILLDNNPKGAHGKACKNFIENSVKGSYIAYEEKNSSFNKYKIVDYANGEYILILDCHVLFEKDSIKSLLDYYNANPQTNDLIQGPLLYDDLKSISTHFDKVWRGSMYGTWGTNKEKYEAGHPFEIEMQGMGMCSFRKKAWKGISEHFKGFGGEEGYISEKFRQWGGKNICIPQLKWNHRFARPNGVKYPLILEERIWNYFIAGLDLYRDPNHPFIRDVIIHFSDKMPEEMLMQILEKAKNKIL